MFEKGDLVEVIKYDPSAHKKYKVGSLHYVQHTYGNIGFDDANVYFKGSDKLNYEKPTNMKHVLLASHIRKVENK